MFNEEVAELAVSYGAPSVVFSTKKDGSVRFCVFYHRLNDTTEQDTYFDTKMNVRIDLLGRAKIFSALDTRSRY